MITIVVWICIAMLAVAVVAGLVVVLRVHDDASRAVVGDLAFFSAMGMLVLLGILKESAAVLDAAMLGAILGILATIALARILTRGQR